MSKELLEKVARAMVGQGYEVQDHYYNIARAAIRAVLAHFAEPANVTDGMREAWLSVGAQSDEDWFDKGCIAAAMDAALKEMGP